MITGTVKQTAAALGFCLAASSAALAQGMALPGKFAVSPTGGATYGIPIVVPPGTAGMSPSLALAYNSHNGNGLLGMGWTLDGLPSIGRCPRTFAQDGVRGGVNYDANDRFCLDGQRLVAISGTYGADGTEYRTEIESFSKIVSHGTAGTGPAWFEVRTKSGQIMEFGNTSDSRVLAQGSATVRSWALNKVFDTKGNYFTVTYTNDTTNGQAYPIRIDYTGNAGAGLQPYNSVQFIYASRPDAVPVYHAGVLTKTTQRLTQVKTFAGVSLVSDYMLAYDQGTATGRSRLSSVQLCDGASTCLPAATFAWESGGVFGFATAPSNPITPTQIDAGTSINFGDWNGDGRTDVMWYDADYGNNRWYVDNGIVNGALTFAEYLDPLIPISQMSRGTILYFGDWNGDGLVDVMAYAQSNGRNRWYVNNGIVNGALTFAEYIDPIATLQIKSGTSISFGDWNGDGRTDVMWYDKGNGNNRWYVNAGVVNGALSFTEYLNPVTPLQIKSGTSINFGDWNGDGQTEIMWYNKSNGNNRWYVNNGVVNGVLNFAEHLNPITPTQIDSGTSISFGDWNGDGRTDVMWYDKSNGNNRWYLNSGYMNAELTFIEHLNPVTTSLISGGTSLYFGDWNSDGLGDVMWHNASLSNPISRWLINNWAASGSLSFTQFENPIDPRDMSGVTVSFGDWNGDGITDAMSYYKSYGLNIWHLNTQTKADVLVSITTGLGATTSITHKPLTDTSVYTKDSGAAAAVYPTIDIQEAVYVVARVDTSNGIGGTASSAYAYMGAKADQVGRGFLGFRQSAATDLQTNIVDITSSRQDFPYIGLVASQLAKLGAQTLSEVTNTYQFSNASGGATVGSPSISDAPYRVSLAQSQTARFDLDGSVLPVVTSTYQYDAYANATEIVVSTNDGHSKTTANTYFNDTSNWLLGRLTGASVTSTTP